MELGERLNLRGFTLRKCNNGAVSRLMGKGKTKNVEKWIGNGAKRQPRRGARKSVTSSSQNQRRFCSLNCLLFVRVERSECEANCGDAAEMGTSHRLGEDRGLVTRQAVAQTPFRLF